MEKSFDFGRLLKNHEKKHKSKPAQFISIAGGVQKRLESNLKNRKSSRLTVFDKIRNLPRCDSPVPDLQLKVEHRRQQLEKWKEEKEKKKKAAAAQKKKPFVAGVPHFPLKFVPPPPPPKPMPSTSGRVTRSQSARQNISKTKPDTKQAKAAPSFAPKNASFQPPQLKNFTVILTLAPVNKNNKNKSKVNYKFDPVLPNTQKHSFNKNTKLKASIKPVETRTTRNTVKEVEKSKGRITKKASPIKNKKSSKTLQSSSSSEIDTSNAATSGSSEVDTASSIEKSPVFKRTPRKSLLGVYKMLTPILPIPKSESSSEEKLRSPKSPIEVPMTPEQIAEEAKKNSPCVTMSRGKDNARKEMKKKMEEGLLDADASDINNVDHFRKQLDSEIKRMTEMCEVWDKIQEHTTLTDSVQELVLAAVGQARLLMSQKMQQFRALVERCARPDPARALVTPADLHGFWDMVFMQVENIDMRFKKLEEMRARNWAEAPAAPAAPAPAANKARAKRAAAPAGGASRLREMIAAARKAKKEQEAPSSPLAPKLAAESKTFEAGFFSVQSPVRSPRGSQPATPSNKTLLKAVLSSEAKKASANKNSTSFAMLRASILSKNVDHDGIAVLPQTPVSEINLYATPGRSILKSTVVPSEKKTGKKSIKVVLFDDSDNDIKEQTSQEEKCESNNDTETRRSVSELNTDSGMSSMDVEKEDRKENKENSRRRGKLIRQDATTEDKGSVMTRSCRKSINTNITEVSTEQVDDKTPRRSSRKKKTLQETESNVVEEKNATPKRSVRSRKSTGMQSVMA